VNANAIVFVLPAFRLHTHTHTHVLSLSLDVHNSGIVKLRAVEPHLERHLTCSRVHPLTRVDDVKEEFFGQKSVRKGRCDDEE
jgi:hypothetical protein